MATNRENNINDWPWAKLNITKAVWTSGMTYARFGNYSFEVDITNGRIENHRPQGGSYRKGGELRFGMPNAISAIFFTEESTPLDLTSSQPFHQVTKLWISMHNSIKDGILVDEVGTWALDALRNFGVRMVEFNVDFHKETFYTEEGKNEKNKKFLE